MNNFILPIILIVLGGIGITGTLWLSSSRIRSRGATISKGSEWFTISPDTLEAELSMNLRQKLRKVLKVLLVWMIAFYRRLAREITVKQVLKKKVRAFLYDHTPNSVRHPSEFWHRVHHKNDNQVIENKE